MTAKVINKILSDKAEDHNTIVFYTENNEAWRRFHEEDNCVVTDDFVSVFNKKLNQTIYYSVEDIVQVITLAHM